MVQQIVALMFISMQNVEETSDVTARLRLAKRRAESPGALTLTVFSPFLLLNFYLKVAWDFFKKCLNELAQDHLPS